MNFTRQDRLARELQRVVSDIFSKEDVGIPKGVLVTVTGTRMSPDLSILKVYVSIFPATRQKEVYDELMARRPNIRYFLGKRIRNTVKEVPEVQIHLDDSLNHIEKIDTLLTD